MPKVEYRKTAIVVGRSHVTAGGQRRVATKVSKKPTAKVPVAM